MSIMGFEMVKDVITSIAAIGGLALGIYNLFKAWKGEKVILTVKPLAIYKLDDKQYGTNEVEIPKTRKLETIGVKVINLSKFEVSLVETGFQFRSGSVHERLCFPHALILGTDNPLPIRIPSREAVIIAFSPAQLPSDPLRKDIESVYIHTACELEFFGVNGVINDFKRA
jgi:hypothetical protein